MAIRACPHTLASVVGHPFHPLTSVPGAHTPRSLPGRIAQRKLIDRFEDVISRATAKYAWAHKLASMIWLPYAFRSGIKIKQLDDKSFGAVLPFRRFNRNWYNAMAGASLLANSEIVGGTYIHGRSGGDYTVVCKELKYRFLRPCYGPAIYRITPVQDLDALLKTGDEFNFDIEIEIVQQLPTRGLGKTIRVGKCTATFHITPKALHEARARRRAAAGKDLPAGATDKPE
ncbi:MAG: hypothetical protein QM783_14905 [Phycisphaerales bacterium]